MNIEQLMVPRVMCIGTEPGTPNDTSGDFITGDVLTQTVKKFGKWKSQMLKCSIYLPPEFVEKFPHLFRPMPWYEGRKPEEMPLYLKSIALYKDFHIVEAKNHYATFFIGIKDGQYWEAPYDEYLPATEAEYLTYKGYRKCPDCDSVWGGNERCPECFPM